MNIKIIGPKDKYVPELINSTFNTTSNSTNWSKGLSPFFLGPCELYDNYKALNVENAWQYSKLYNEFADENNNPTQDYFNWAQMGWSKKYADRYPMGKGRIPICSIWNGEKLDYIESRKKIYVPLYAKAVVKTQTFLVLQDEYEENKNITLWDYDGYDYAKKGMTLEQVLNEPNLKMGHAFVLAMLLEEKIIVDKNEIIFNF